MNKTELLITFEPWDEPHRLRDTPELTELLRTLPADPVAYVEAAQDMLNDLTAEIYEGWMEEVNVYRNFCFTTAG